jgi:hypothetical protein
MRWSSVFSYLSAGVLVAAVVGQIAQWPAAAVQWLLLAWAILLIPVALVLFRHPMRRPAWGLFLGFWGFLALITLVVLQYLAVADVLRQPSRTFAESWPIGVFAVWLAVTSLLGRPDDTETDLSGPVTWLGALAGAALLASAIIGIAQAHGAIEPAFFVAAVAYVLWAAALSGEIWAFVPGRRRSQAPPSALRNASSPPGGEELAAPAPATP